MDTLLFCIPQTGEGSVITRSPFEPKLTIESAELEHGGADPYRPLTGSFCGGKFSLVRPSEAKQVLVCNRCYLRLDIPNKARVIADLVKI